MHLIQLKPEVLILAPVRESRGKGTGGTDNTKATITERFMRLHTIGVSKKKYANLLHFKVDNC